MSTERKCKLKKTTIHCSTQDKKSMCPSTLIVRIYLPEASRISDHPENLALTITYHPIHSGHVLSFRSVTEAVKKVKISLFESVSSAASAKHEYLTQLQLKSDPRVVESTLADRAITPNVQDIQRLFRKCRSDNIGPENGNAMFERLLKEVQRYNKEHEKEGGRVFLQPYEAAAAMSMDEPKPKSRKTDAMPFLLALVTPLMARVHEMVTQSAKLVFCDSTASLDNLNTAVFILSCGTSVGALPLAAVMTSSEDAVTLPAGFTALCHILPNCAFLEEAQILDH